MATFLTIDDQLSGVLSRAVARLDAASGAALPEAAYRWEMPKEAAFGDLSASIAFKLAGPMKQAPPALAQRLADVFVGCCRDEGFGGWIERVEPRGGFLNIFLSADALAQVMRDVLRLKERYGRREVASAPSINIEFVSANPTGPLSVAHGRQAAVGDVLARLFRAQGWKATTEFYLNDEGNQIELLGASLRARCAQALGREEAVPPEGYQGEYLVELAQRLRQREGEALLNRPTSWFTDEAMREQLAQIKADLARFGLTFDEWTSQQWLSRSGRLERSLEALRARGVIYEADEAVWFRSTEFGDDKDRVVRKRDGEWTYLAPDIAYHQWKAERGYDQLLNLWGPDHHGYIARVKAAMAALGLTAERLTVKIVQLVTLSRGGKAVPMSKRQGHFVTFREILDEVGVDATRFFYLMRTMESHLDFDLDLAKSQSQENPVYYVQYAHARICSILAKDRLPFWTTWRPRLAQLREPDEQLLMRMLFQYPIVIRLCAAAFEPHGMTGYLRRLAEQFHVFYTKHRVLGEAPAVSAARLALVRATRQVLANGLGLLGISAPRRM